MSIWLILLIILICLFVEIFLLSIAGCIGFFLPGAIYSWSEGYTVWKDGYMPMIKDMKKYWKHNRSFKGYNFYSAFVTYIVSTVYGAEDKELEK